MPGKIRSGSVNKRNIARRSRHPASLGAEFGMRVNAIGLMNDDLVLWLYGLWCFDFARFR